MSETYQAPPNGFRTFVIVWATQSISVFGRTRSHSSRLNIWLTQTLYPHPEQKSQLAVALSLVACRSRSRWCLRRRSPARGPTVTTASGR